MCTCFIARPCGRRSRVRFKAIRSSTSACGDVAKTGQLNVLTLNMLFDAPAQARHNSWVDIANFASANNVHVLFLQEGVLSDVDRIQRLLGTSNSARDLQQILNQRAAEPYNLRIAWETGVPLVLSTANAILSRCNISRDFFTFLPIESEVVFEGLELKITRNVQMVQTDIPGLGSLHLFNTHLCSGCSAEGLQQQVNSLLAFIRQVQGKVPGSHVLLGGDLNLDVTKGAAEQAVYQSITKAGFRDAYAEYRRTAFGEPPGSLCANGRPDIHCTDGVSSMQGLSDAQTGGEFARPARLDYLFLIGGDTVSTSRVVFNPGNAATGPIQSGEPPVSDHSGVFTQITLAR